MRIAVTIQHGGNVHLFRHPIAELQRRGHEVFVFSREQGVNVDLLDAYGLDHECLRPEPDTLPGLAVTQVLFEADLFRRLRRIDPDVIAASHGIAASHVAPLVGARSCIFVDTDAEVVLGSRLASQFAHRICRPQWLRTPDDGRCVDYAGLHELSYLAPDRFTPDASVLEGHGVDPSEPFAVVRFGAWKSHHDVGKRGFSPAGKRRLIDALARRGPVYVADESVEDDPGADVVDHTGVEPLPVPPEHFHHLLAEATVCVGEVATTTIEAAVLGTPTVRVSPFAGPGDMGKFDELERRGLVRSFPSSAERAGIETVRRLYDDPGAGRRWERRRDAFLDETVDVCSFVVEQVLEAGS